MGGIIASLEPGCIAEELGWRTGDVVESINGHPLQDEIDYRFYSAEELVTVEIRRGRERAEFEIEKDPDEPLGVIFQDALFDGIRTCDAKCVFCFVDQLPKGLRKTLYLKDDDYRLSFLDGNFVTLANCTDSDIDRIAIQRLSPLYLSVHATDHDLRSRMLGRKIPDVLAQIDRLSEGRIELHTQIVLCRGLNDGEQLAKSVADLAARFPTVRSIAVVPEGVTVHRKRRTTGYEMDRQYCREIVRFVRTKQREFKSALDTRLIWASDEFYLRSGYSVPSKVSYEGFPQYENGVGIVRCFVDSARQAARAAHQTDRPQKYTLVTGTLAAPVLEDWACSLVGLGLDVRVVAVRNQLLGETVTVAGLMAGRDIVTQLAGLDLGEAVLVPSVAVRDHVFIDDVSAVDIGDALGVPVMVVEPDAQDALNIMLSI